MRLSALISEGERVGPADLDPDITGLASDSRAVRPGDLFAALPGARVDGAAFVEEAIARGAGAILTSPGRALDVPSIQAENPRRELARIAAAFYRDQPRHLLAVTGTNGKTSVAGFVRQIFAALGEPAASLGTLGCLCEGVAAPPPVGPSLTTPDPIALQRMLAELVAAGVQHAALEASSHGLAQSRLDGLRLAAAAYTNLTRDHLDYHGSFEAYRDAKARLFTELLPDGSTAVLNVDQPEIAALVVVCRDRGLHVLDYGRGASAIRLLSVRTDADGQGLSLEIEGRRHELRLGLVGAFQADNVMAALGLALAAGAPLEQVLGILPSLRGAPGRMQRVGTHASGAPVFVDYAHTPDALDNVLRALRPHTGNRLVVVFGCGGDRDPGKRPQMGRIAALLADRVIVTDDNPRSEPPAAIRAAVLTAAPGATEVGDRREAIRRAVATLATGDVLVVAGKGHESGQIVGSEVLPFDDALEVRAALEALGAAA